MSPETADDSLAAPINQLINSPDMDRSVNCVFTQDSELYIGDSHQSLLEEHSGDVNILVQARWIEYPDANPFFQINISNFSNVDLRYLINFANDYLSEIDFSGGVRVVLHCNETILKTFCNDFESMKHSFRIQYKQLVQRVEEQ